MRVYFVRHGESVANVEDTFSSTDPAIHPLTHTGVEQVAELAETLKTVTFEAAYCSDLLRAVQTVEILLNGRGLEYRVDQRLREHNMGVFDGRSDKSAWDALRELVRIWDEDGQTEVEPDGGESLDVLQERFFTFIDDLVRDAKNDDAIILIVAHVGLFWSTLPRLFTNIDRAFVRAREFGNAGVVIGAHHRGTWTCESWVGEKLPD
ncbi:MAG: histidine phosphatase family protein [Anaerolineales bacterium]